MERDMAHGISGNWGAQGEVWFQDWENGRPTINYGSNGLSLLDQAVQQAEAAGIRFIMVLTKYVDEILLLLGPEKLMRSQQLG